MSSAVNLDDRVISAAKAAASVSGRSMAEQIEHWCLIGKAAEENPDLTHSFISDVRASMEMVENGDVKPWVRQTPK